MQGLVSTIIPVYNRAEMLLEAVQSVLKQTYRPIEIIIVDDGSTDETPTYAQKLSDKHNEVSLITINNSGPGVAREAGRLISKGEFIQYLDSDDLLMPDKFHLQVKGLNDHAECVLSYCMTSVEIISENKTSLAWKRTGEKIDTILPSMLAERWWGTSTPLYRSVITDKAGPWKEWVNEEDWEYDCRIGSLGGSLHYVPTTLSLQRHHDESRLSNDGSSNPIKLRSRAKAHQEIINHAIKYGIGCDSLEFCILIKSTFLLSRQCGAVGLVTESNDLFHLAKKHLLLCDQSKTQLALYELGSNLLGWRNMGKLSALLDRFRWIKP